MRGRSYSYSPSPPRGYGRRRRSPSPRGRYGGRGRDLPTSLLVRNLRHDCRPEDLRGPFSQFGRLKDIYLPRDYHTGEPRGFGFVQFVDPADAADAKYHMDGCVLLGRELTVVFAEENRKKPSEMRAREPSRGQSYDRRRSSLHILNHRAMHDVILVVRTIIPLPPDEGDTQGLYHQETGGTERDLTLRHPTGHAAGVQAEAGVGARALTTLDELLLSEICQCEIINIARIIDNKQSKLHNFLNW
ncbi:hypothetical protein Dsin_007000 [Dipteronia sinensis]|uniref:RRM domain-containing protein n=1 Tax=Dipteronia sinensis TaxID=43782 RepID=A0AAE0EG35_9ROSI|nr:hypothetical protein Dsin_007000 [Dipteronia sinensis]